MRLLAPKTKQSYLFLAPLGSGLGKAVVAIYPGRAMQWDALAFLPHPAQTLPLPRPLAFVRFDPPACLAGLTSAGLEAADQMAACWAGFTSPVAMCVYGVCAFVLLRCFSCSHTVLPKEHSLGVIFFSSLSSCHAVFFFNSTCISLLIILCMIVYVTNNKEPWTLNPEPIIYRLFSILNSNFIHNNFCFYNVWLYPRSHSATRIIRAAWEEMMTTPRRTSEEANHQRLYWFNQSLP